MERHLFTPSVRAPWAVFVGIMTILALTVPVAYGPRLEPGLTPAHPVQRCFALSYSRRSSWGDLPLRAVLESRPARSVGAPNWAEATLASTHVVPGTGMWRQITQDSIELRWHHSPSLRIHIEGQTATGIVVPAGISTMFGALLDQPRTISGHEVDCALPVVRPAG